MAAKMEQAKKEKKVRKSRKSTETFKWSSELETEFIEAVHQEECIWDYRKSEYKDRRIRHQGFKRVLTKMSHHSAGIHLTVDDCKKKWNALRCYFQILLNSERGKSGGEAKYPPSWSHFSTMSFLRPILNTTESFENFVRKPCTSKEVKISDEADEAQNLLDETPEETSRLDVSLDQIMLEESQQTHRGDTRDEDEAWDEVSDQPTEDPLDSSDKPATENSDRANGNQQIQHSQKNKKRKVMDEPDELSSAVIKFLQESREDRQREETEELTSNEKRGIIWGQDLNKIKNSKVLYKCITNITTVIQNALIEDEESG